MNIAISVGHYPGDPGAKNGKHNEYRDCAVIAACVVYAIQGLGHNAWLIGSGRLKKKVDQVNDLHFIDCAVEIHLNAGGGSGCEALYCPGTSENNQRLAELIAKNISDQTGLKSRGAKPGWHRMDAPGVEDYAGDVDGDENKDYFLRATKCPAAITEAFFIDGNKSLLGRFTMYTAIANGIALGCLEWGGAI